MTARATPRMDPPTDRCSGSAVWVSRDGQAARVAWERRAARAARAAAAADPAREVTWSVLTPWDELTLPRGWVSRTSREVPGRRYFVTVGHVFYLDAGRSAGGLCAHADETRFTAVDGLVAVVLANGGEQLRPLHVADGDLVGEATVSVDLGDLRDSVLLLGESAYRLDERMKVEKKLERHRRANVREERLRTTAARAATRVDELVAELERAEQRIADLEGAAAANGGGTAPRPPEGRLALPMAVAAPVGDDEAEPDAA